MTCHPVRMLDLIQRGHKKSLVTIKPYLQQRPHYSINWFMVIHQIQWQVWSEARLRHAIYTEDVKDKEVGLLKIFVARDFG